MKNAIRQVRRDFQKKRGVLRKTVNKMYDADLEFDKIVDEKMKIARPATPRV
jgi:hypothetical protein